VNNDITCTTHRAGTITMLCVRYYTDQVEVASWFAHAGQNRLLGEYVAEDSDDHGQQEQKVT